MKKLCPSLSLGTMFHQPPRQSKKACGSPGPGSGRPSLQPCGAGRTPSPGRIDKASPWVYKTFMALQLSTNRRIGGVCGGLAAWLGWDPTLVRILYTLLTIFTAFSGLIVYLLLWIIMPRESQGNQRSD